MSESRLTKFITKHVSKAFISEIVNDSITDALRSIGKTVIVHKIETKLEDKDKKPSNLVEGIVHEQFNTVLSLVSQDLPVFLTGKAGSGKNHLCKQIADALGLEFYFTNAVTHEYRLTGFIDANGHYHETQFYKAFKNGGLFFLDEMDASVPETLVVLNAAIANRYFDFPTGKIVAHPDFRIIAAGNTTGTGSNEVYTGRYQLDGASLDRFSVINIDYSKSIEMSMTFQDSELVEFAHAFRKASDDAFITCICSYRALNAISVLNKTSKLTLPEILQISLTKGLDAISIDAIVAKLANSNLSRQNRYYQALKEIR